MNQSVVKAFELLSCFTETKSSWGVRELAQRTGYNKSTVYRLLQTLAQLQIVYQDPYEKYHLGSKLFERGNRVSFVAAARQLIHPQLQEIARLIDETVLFSVRRSSGVLHLDQADSNNGLKLSREIGKLQPFHATASGKLLMAYSDRQEQERILDAIDFHAFTENTLVSVPCLQKELEQVREQSYALDVEEFEDGLVCLALPIRNGQNHVIGAISACGPASRFRSDKVASYIEVMQPGKLELEASLREFSGL